jgi:hypothetical protein
MTAAFSSKPDIHLSGFATALIIRDPSSSKISIADGYSSAANTHMSKAVCVTFVRIPVQYSIKLGPILSATPGSVSTCTFLGQDGKTGGLALFGGRIGFDRLIRQCIRSRHLRALFRRIKMEKCNTRVAKTAQKEAKTKGSMPCDLCTFKLFRLIEPPFHQTIQDLRNLFAIIEI